MRRTILLLLLALSIVPYVVGLDDNAIWDANEAFYVETPRQMIERGDYLNPSFNGRPRFNKPPLSYWIVAGFYHAFGVSVESERIAIALGGLVLIGVAFLIARRAFSFDAGLMAALAIASAPRVVMFARRIFIDVYIAAFMGLTLLCLVLAESQPARRRTWLVLMYVSVGLAFMTKGPIAVVLPGGVLLAYLVLERRLAGRGARRDGLRGHGGRGHRVRDHGESGASPCPRPFPVRAPRPRSPWRDFCHGLLGDLRRLMLPTGALIVAAIVVPWYAVLYAEHGWVYIWRFFVEENLSRYTAPYGSTAAGRGPFFYVPVLLTDLFPWSIFLPAALYAAARAVWPFRGDATAPRRMSRLLLLWVAVIVGFFTLSQTKQDLYIFPAVTAIAALIGGLVGPAVRAARGDAPAAVRWSAFAAGALVAAAGGGVLFLFASAAKVYAIDGAALTGWAAVAAGSAAAVFAARRQVFASVVAIGVAAVVLNWVFVLQALPSFRQYQPVPRMSDAIRVRAGADARVAYYRMAVPSLAYYLRRPVLELFEPQQVIDAFGEGEIYCLVTALDYAALVDQLPKPTCVIARAPLFDVKIGNVLQRRPLPQLWLVTNRCEGP